MRQIVIDHTDSSKLGTYKVFVRDKNLSAMQSTCNSELRRVLKKPKRFRSAFSTEQTNYLEEQYKQFQYINREQRQNVASILKIGERPIKIWFQNRRMKEKKENHKEFDDDICGNRGRLNNVPALPSANDHHLYSLPILSPTADTTAYANINNVKVNIADSKEKLATKPESPNSTTPSIEQKVSPPKANFYKEVNTPEHLSSYFHQHPIVDTTVPFKCDEINDKSPSQENKSIITSAEFSINLCKKYKQKCASTGAAATEKIANEDQRINTKPKHALKMDTNRFNLPKGLPPSKKCKVSYPPPPKVPTHMNLNNHVYYSIPSVYSPPITSMASPYMASDGVLWKPVNFMPVMASNATPLNIGHQAPPAHAAHEQNNNCICNCHSNSQRMPVTFPATLQNPYSHAQYMITVPFPHTSPSF